MSEIFEKYSKLIENKEYKKIIEIISNLFILIAPSFSFMFLYKRDLFLSLDIFRLTMICIIMNIMLFAIFYIVINIKTYLISNLRLKKNQFELYKNNIRLYELNKKLDRQELDSTNVSKDEIIKMKDETKYMSKQSEDMKKIIDETDDKILLNSIIIETTCMMFYSTVVIWFFYAYDLVLKTNVTYETKIFRCTSYLSLTIVVYIVRIVKLIFEVKKIKEEISKIEGDIYLLE